MFINQPTKYTIYGENSWSSVLLRQILHFSKWTVYFILHVCINSINSIKSLFIIPTDAHNYKIIGMSKTNKIPTVGPTCFGSRRSHHQGAISCLAKTTITILLCSSLMTWSLLWRHTSLMCKRAVHGRGRNFSVIVAVLIVFNFPMFL
jgi:hypothetical protein